MPPSNQTKKMNEVNATHNGTLRVPILYPPSKCGCDALSEPYRQAIRYLDAQLALARAQAEIDIRRLQAAILGSL